MIFKRLFCPGDWIVDKSIPYDVTAIRLQGEVQVVSVTVATRDRRREPNESFGHP